MQYEGRLFRPPSEAYSLIVQVTIGCSHNKCTFCDMYKEKQFRVRPLEDVLQDLRLARERYGSVRRIFLADGDALICKTEHLLAILEAIAQLFPECERVGSYGSPKSILIKTPQELQTLAQAGLGIVYLGLESGSDAILKAINKGETADEIVRAGCMVKEAGVPLSVTAISGLGGQKLWEEHAAETGKAFTQMKPHYIGLLTLMLEEGTELFADWQAGVFETLTPITVAKETLLMLEHMDCEGSVFRSNHASNYLSLKGTLNRDKAAMVADLTDAITRGGGFKSEEWRRL